MNSIDRSKRDLLGGLIATVFLVSGIGGVLKSPKLSPFVECGETYASSFFDSSVRTGFGGTEQTAFEPLIHDAEKQGFEPEFAFRAKCGPAVFAGIRATKQLPSSPTERALRLDTAYVAVHSAAILNALCKLRMSGRNGESSEACTDSTFTALALLSELEKHERTTNVPTLIEHNVLHEATELRDSPRVRFLFAGLSEGLKSEALAYAHSLSDQQQAVERLAASIAINLTKATRTKIMRQ